MPSNFDALRKGRDIQETPAGAAAKGRRERKRCVDEIARAHGRGTTDWQRRDAVRLKDRVMKNSRSAELIRFDIV